MDKPPKPLPPASNLSAPASNNPATAQHTRAGSHLLFTAGLGLLACQLPLLAWLMLRSRFDAERLPLTVPWLGQLHIDPGHHLWLSLGLTLAAILLCLNWLKNRIVEPLAVVRDQLCRLSANHYEPESRVETGSQEIADIANACDALRVQLAQRAAEHQKLAFEDAMTGLHNRVRFVLDVDRVLASSLKRVVVIAWRLDRFNSLNSILGFAAGEHLLRALGLRLKTLLQDSISVARLSSHTFACAFELDEEGCPQALINRVLDTLADPVRVFGQPIELTAACGAAISPRDGHAASDLTRRAEIAQNIASQSRLRWILFQNHFEVQSSARLNMLSELRAALQTPGQLQLFLQPKLNLSSGRIEEAEALLRWQHPQRGLVYPNDFIPFAEQTGRIHDITLWAIEEAAGLVARLQSDRPVRISVNISAMDLHESGFADAVAAVVARSHIAADLLCLEITESWAMDRPEQVLETLDKLHDLGVKLAIDDFGSGYSSMAYMKRFPVDELKIDRSLVAGIKRNSDSETILRCITDLGHSMGLTVTAEGVETLEEYAAVKALSVDCIQGYLVGKAMPMVQFRQFLQRFDSSQLLPAAEGSDRPALSNRPTHPTHVGRQQHNQAERNAIPGENAEIVRADVTQQPSNTDKRTRKARHKPGGEKPDIVK